MIWLKDLIGGGDGRVPVGTFMKIPSIESVEIIKLAGFDFIIVDAEHAPLTLADLNRMIVVARALDLPPLVRVPDHGYGDVQRILDAGAAGLLFPHVSDAAQCEAVVRQASHPPYGTRGAGGGMRAGDWGMGRGPSNYVEDGATKVMRIPMIEEKEAVDNADGILSVSGVDGIFIGPGDLSMTMGLSPGDLAVQDAIGQTFTKAKERGIPVATVAGDAAGGRRLIERGFDFVVVGNDTGMLGRAAAGIVEEIRG
jgi:2-keto-3-deoxy-L-rhamnonate aldolase RhmA